MDYTHEKKSLCRAKSCNGSDATKTRSEATKRKSMDEEMVKDLALRRLKKSKLVNVEGLGSLAIADAVSDLPSVSTVSPSAVSTNFSYYELMRNLSRSNTVSEGAYSGSTNNTCHVDPLLKNEHLERYFRSVDMWYRKNQRYNCPSVHFHVPD